MRCACIDVGSNTTRLLVADATEGTIGEVVNERVFTLIGRSLAGGDRIPAAKVAEAAAAVAAQAGRARELGAERIRAVATAAIRGAANAHELVHAVERDAGIALEVLAGEDEARLAFRGAAHAVGGGLPGGATRDGGAAGPGAGTLAVADVGGGSTELAFGRADGRIERAVSIAIGSSLLADRHLASDPPTVAQLDAALAEATAAFGAVEPERADRAVAVGGSASSLARLAGDDLGPAELARAMDVLCDAPAAEVAARYRLDPARARLLPAGLVILAQLAACLGAPLRICRGGLREGVILEMAQRPTGPVNNL